MNFSSHFGTRELLTKLAPEKVESSPFPDVAVGQLKQEVIDRLARRGWQLKRHHNDHTHCPYELSNHGSLTWGFALDLEVGLGDYSLRVRLGPGARMPRLPAQYLSKKRVSPGGPSRSHGVSRTSARHGGRLEQHLPIGGGVDRQDRRGPGTPARQSVARSSSLFEQQARARCPNIVVESLDAIRKDKPDGIVTARVLVDGTHEISIIRRTRIRDQEGAPIAPASKRVMREKTLRLERRRLL